MRKSVSQVTRFQIQKLLESVIDVDNGCVKYNEGWNDARVAGELKVSPKTVANTRTKTFGKLCGQPLPTKARLVEIENRLSELELRLLKEVRGRNWGAAEGGDENVSPRMFKLSEKGA